MSDCVYSETLLNGWLGHISYKTIGRITVLTALLNGDIAINPICFKFNHTLSETTLYPNLPKAMIPFPIYNITDSIYEPCVIYKENNSNYYLQLVEGKRYYINIAYINNKNIVN